MKNYNKVIFKGKEVDNDSIVVDIQGSHPEFEESYIVEAHYKDGSIIEEEDLRILESDYPQIQSIISQQSTEGFWSSVYDRVKANRHSQ